MAHMKSAALKSVVVLLQIVCLPLLAQAAAPVNSRKLLKQTKPAQQTKASASCDAVNYLAVLDSAVRTIEKGVAEQAITPTAAEKLKAEVADLRTIACSYIGDKVVAVRKVYAIIDALVESKDINSQYQLYLQNTIGWALAV